MGNKSIDILLKENSRLFFLKSGEKVCLSLLTDKSFIVEGFSAVTIDLEKDLSSESKDLLLKFLNSIKEF